MTPANGQLLRYLERVLRNEVGTKFQVNTWTLDEVIDYLDAEFPRWYDLIVSDVREFDGQLKSKGMYSEVVDILIPF